MSEELIYYEKLQQKVARMKQEWLENHITGELINEFFACAKEELANEGKGNE